jgi:hypothetical protein
MKIFLFLPVFFVLHFNNVIGQEISEISNYQYANNSFYHIEKINDNEFWIGGKGGVLEKIDTLGKIFSLNILDDTLSILKIEKVGNYVFIATENAVIYRYNLDDRRLIKRHFPKFEGLCFYDLIGLKNGDILVCGGARAIVRGEKKIPKGFIATLNLDLESVTVVWQSKRKFVWSIIQRENGEVLATTFNGISTKIISSSSFKKWETSKNVRGLVHEIAILESELWYSGTKNINYKKQGIVGGFNHKTSKIKHSGCLWSMSLLNDKLISVTEHGNLILIDKSTNEIHQLDLPGKEAMYDIQSISKTKLLLIGRGENVYIVDFKDFNFSQKTSL